MTQKEYESIVQFSGFTCNGVEAGMDTISSDNRVKKINDKPGKNARSDLCQASRSREGEGIGQGRI